MTPLAWKMRSAVKMQVDNEPSAWMETEFSGCHRLWVKMCPVVNNFIRLETLCEANDSISNATAELDIFRHYDIGSDIIRFLDIFKAQDIERVQLESNADSASKKDDE